MSNEKYEIGESANLVGKEIEVRDTVYSKILYEMRFILLEGATLSESPLDVILDVYLDKTEEETDPKVIRALTGFSRIYLHEENIQITANRESTVDFEQLALDVIAAYKEDLLKEDPSFLTHEQVEEARKNGLPTTNRFKPLREKLGEVLDSDV